MKIGFDRNLRIWNEAEGVAEIVAVCRKTGASSVWYMIKAALDGECTPATIRENIRRFERLRDPLRDAGFEAGIHFYSIGMSERGQQYSDTFQHIVGANGKESRACFCPLDPAFQQHVSETVRAFAAAGPDFIAVCMDDVTLSGHFPAAGGCVCQRHMDLLGGILGQRLSVADLVAGMQSEQPDALPVKRAFYNAEKESIVGHIRNIRAAINTVNPNIPLTIVNAGSNMWWFTQELLDAAAEGSVAPRLKYHAGIYMNDTKYLLPHVFSHIAFQMRFSSPTEENGFWEADIVPYHRFGISTATLRTLITGIRLLGVPDLWCTMGSHVKVLTRAQTCAPFLEMYDRNKTYFAEVDRIARGVQWQGPATMFAPDILTQVGWNEAFGRCGDPSGAGWQSILGAMAIPHQVWWDAPVRMLTGNIAPLLARSEIEKALRGGLLLDGPAAQHVCKLGLGHLIGAEVHARDAVEQTVEKFLALPGINRGAAGEYMNAAHNPQSVKTIVPESARTLVAGCFVDAVDGAHAHPSLVLFENEVDGRVATYAYDLTGPVAGFAGRLYAFLFQNDDRREQLIGVLEWLAGGKPLPAVTRTGVEAYLMYGHRPASGEDVLALFNSCYDPIAPLEIRFAGGVPEEALFLDAQGRWLSVQPVVDGEWLTYDIDVAPMQPCVMRLRFPKEG